MNTAYLEVISLVERLHRHFLEVVKLELEGLGIHDINNVQGMMLFNIGDAEMTVGELTLRGCYLGSNVSYNVKKLVEMGYLHHARSRVDRSTAPATVVTGTARNAPAIPATVPPTATASRMAKGCSRSRGPTTTG